MLKLGIYEQVVNEMIVQELASLSEAWIADRQSIDSAESATELPAKALPAVQICLFPRIRRSHFCFPYTAQTVFMVRYGQLSGSRLFA